MEIRTINMTLSDKIQEVRDPDRDCYVGDFIDPEDVEEFIRQLKERISTDEFIEISTTGEEGLKKKDIFRIINKLAGDKLI